MVKPLVDNTRNRILHAAGTIFAEKGFESATVREICNAANSNLSSINYHFGDKETLYLETLKLSQVLKKEQSPFPPFLADVEPEEKLRVFVQIILHRMIGEPELGWPTRLMMREMLHPTSASEHFVEGFIRPQFNILLSILNDLLPPETELHLRRKIAFSVIGQCLHYRVSAGFVSILLPEDERAEHFGIEQLAEHIVEFTLAALKHYSPSFQKSPTE